MSGYLLPVDTDSPQLSVIPVRSKAFELKLNRIGGVERVTEWTADFLLSEVCESVDSGPLELFCVEAARNLGGSVGR